MQSLIKNGSPRVVTENLKSREHKIQMLEVEETCDQKSRFQVAYPTVG